MKYDSTLTPLDIYNMPAQEITNDLCCLAGCYFNHLEGTTLDQNAVAYGNLTSNRVEIKIIKNFNFDFRRFWRLATVWFDGAPVMIIQNAGREGDDWGERFITDPTRFYAMGEHIRTLLPITQDRKELTDVVDVNDPLGRKLIEFYGNELDGYFERY